MKSKKKILMIGIAVALAFSGINVIADDCNPTVRLPSNYATMVVEFGTNSYFKVNLSDVPPGFDITNGEYLSWCVQYGILMAKGVNHTIALYSSYDPNMPSSFQDENWSKVNYVLNHKQDYNLNRILLQKVIWYLIDENYKLPPDPVDDVLKMISDADENGSDFCPETGDVIAILASCDTSVQRIFLELSLTEPGENGNGSIPDEGNVSNHAPTANAFLGEPYQGFVNSEMIFDGSHSYDLDGDIVSWYWDFGDGTNETGETVTHVYSYIGNYTVLLIVTDNDGATDSYSTMASIIEPGSPPTDPIVNGTKIGYKNIEYQYTAVSIDFDNHTIRYIFDWDDGTKITTTGFFENNTIVNATHNWTETGVYLLKVYAEDELKFASNNTEIMVLIDVDIEFIDDEVKGYLIDYEKDGIYNVFYNNETGGKTDVEPQDNGTYLIDIDEDGKWDYTYDSEMDTLSKYVQEKDEANNNSVWYALGLGVIISIILLIIIYLVKKKGNKPGFGYVPNKYRKKR
jgi:PKD repeat protein